MIRARTLDRPPGANQVFVLQHELNCRQLRAGDVLDARRHQLVATLARPVVHVLRKHAGDVDSGAGERLVDDRLDARINAHGERHPAGIGQRVVGGTGKLRAAAAVDLHLADYHERALERLHRRRVIRLHEVKLGRLRQGVVAAHHLDQMHGIAGVRHKLQQAVEVAQRRRDAHLVAGLRMTRLAAAEIYRDPGRAVLKVKQRVAAAGHVCMRGDNALGGKEGLRVRRLAVIIHQRAQVLDGDHVATGRVLHLERGRVALHCAVGIADRYHIVAGIISRDVRQLEGSRCRVPNIHPVPAPLVRQRPRAGGHDRE